MDFGYEQSLVHELLREQFPELAALDLREVEGGWDNQQWRLGDSLGVRLPRTQRGPALLRKEQQWLPNLAERLPLPVPVPVRIGRPSPRFDKPWSITRWVEGEPADRTPIVRVESADVLADFLTALHQPAPQGAPTNDRGIPLREIGTQVELSFDVIEDRTSRERARATWQQALAAPVFTENPLWLHGDLHPANVIVEDGGLAGVVDFGDLSTGDPAADLAAAWMLLPMGSDRRFFQRYESADDATITRARGWAVLRALGLIQVGRNGRFGRPGGKPTWEPAGYATLERVLAED